MVYPALLPLLQLMRTPRLPLVDWTAPPPSGQFKWTRPFRWKAKYGFCACAITFQTCSTTVCLTRWRANRCRCMQVRLYVYRVTGTPFTVLIHHRSHTRTTIFALHVWVRSPSTTRGVSVLRDNTLCSVLNPMNHCEPLNVGCWLLNVRRRR